MEGGRVTHHHCPTIVQRVAMTSTGDWGGGGSEACSWGRRYIGIGLMTKEICGQTEGEEGLYLKGSSSSSKGSWELCVLPQSRDGP